MVAFVLFKLLDLDVNGDNSYAFEGVSRTCVFIYDYDCCRNYALQLLGEYKLLC